MSEHVIDCDADPFVPDGWEVPPEEQLSNRVRGRFKWYKDAQKDALYLWENQKNGKWAKGYELCEKLVDKPVLNANVLNYLLVHPHLIPEEWKSKRVFF